MMASSALHNNISSGLSSMNSEPKKTASSVHDVRAKKPPFGSRYLTADKDVWSKNAWDHVPPPDDQHERITSSLARQYAKPVPEEEKNRYNEKPARHWDNFYKTNADNFFRDRKWLHTEFAELVAATQPEAGPLTIAEIGCGAGNSVFPLLAANQNPKLQLYAFDYSNHAVKLIQRNELYNSPPVGSVRASVWDLTSKEGLPDGIAPSSVDIVVLIFVMSALHPNEWAQAVSNIYKMLKVGGLVVLRDYGRHDLTQLRFKEGRLLDDNFYIRGDKTRVYFFDLDDLAMMFTGSPALPKHREMPTPSPEVVYEDDESTGQDGAPATSEGRSSASVIAPPSASNTPTREGSQSPALPSLQDAVGVPPSIPPESNSPNQLSTTATATEAPSTSTSTSNIHSRLHDRTTVGAHPGASRHPSDCPPHPLFSIEQLGVDRRLLVNRKRQLKMYRVWMQGKFRKLPPAVERPGSTTESEGTVLV